MIGKKATEYLLNRYFEDCFAFWVNEGKDDRDAFKMALEETSHVKRNPFSPMGELLDEDAKAKYLEKMRKELD